jgi:hypothetical protein
MLRAKKFRRRREEAEMGINEVATNVAEKKKHGGEKSPHSLSRGCYELYTCG